MSSKGPSKTGVPPKKRQKVAAWKNRGAGPKETLALFRHPSEFMNVLLAPTRFDVFTREYWEKKPLVLSKREGASWPIHFSKSTFFGLAKAKVILFERDVAACKYVAGERVNFDRAGRATEAKMQKLYDDGATLQIHQPQRWVDGIWEALEQLECLFGCLVGSNAYITPPSSQGLAPHHDDVEVFVLQLEGSKAWRLYAPPMELPRTYSKDFTQEEIGPPTHEFTLQPGDLLYMPRGTIHQACTLGDSHSTHLTISTYQNHSIGEYLKSVIPNLVEKVMDCSVELRRGLPIGFLPRSTMKKSTVEAAVEHFQEQLKNFSGDIPKPSDLLRDFMLTRLPPIGFDKDSLADTTPEGEPPSLTDDITLAYPSHVACLLDDSGDEEEALLLTSLLNDRETHMMLSDEHNVDGTGIVRFPGHFLPALEQFCVSRDFIRGEVLELPSNEEKTVLLTSLWSLHLLRVR